MLDNHWIKEKKSKEKFINSLEYNGKKITIYQNPQNISELFSVEDCSLQCLHCKEDRVKQQQQQKTSSIQETVWQFIGNNQESIEDGVSKYNSVNEIQKKTIRKAK